MATIATIDLTGLVQEFTGLDTDATIQAVLEILEDEDDLREALTQALPAFIANVREPGGRFGREEPPKPRRGNAASKASKTSVFDQRLPYEGGWKRLGDCTAADLTKIAQTFKSRATRYEKLAKRLRDTNKKKVVDLGVREVERLLR